MKNVIKQKTIGLNPLEDYLSQAKQEDNSQNLNQNENDIHIQKQRVTFHLSVDLVNKLKNAVYWEPGLTLASLAETALSKALGEMETERGAPFPERREHRLKGGRPIK